MRGAKSKVADEAPTHGGAGKNRGEAQHDETDASRVENNDRIRDQMIGDHQNTRGDTRASPDWPVRGRLLIVITTGESPRWAEDQAAERGDGRDLRGAICVGNLGRNKRKALVICWRIWLRLVNFNA